jgi:hypothetical protein
VQREERELVFFSFRTFFLGKQKISLPKLLSQFRACLFFIFVSVLPTVLLNLKLFTDFYKFDINILSAVVTANIVIFYNL